MLKGTPFTPECGLSTCMRSATHLPHSTVNLGPGITHTDKQYLKLRKAVPSRKHVLRTGSSYTGVTAWRPTVSDDVVSVELESRETYDCFLEGVPVILQRTQNLITASLSISPL